MKQLVTEAIVLKRTNFGEADRILTVLTPSQGKLRLLAKGVRKIRSKLAGGVELLSVTSLTYIVGKGQINTLVSSRLSRHYGNIVKDLARTTFSYEVMKSIDRITEDASDEEYFALLDQTLAGLNELELPLVLVQLWFYINVLKLNGHTPNLRYDGKGNKLAEAEHYSFSFDDMTFAEDNRGSFTTTHIKLLRILITADHPGPLTKFTVPASTWTDLLTLLKAALRQ